uniref:Uncharacterized protein n=1 Tax=Oryza brachyantha TaxID=4533 RepID=J3LDV6_ORYBR
EGRYHCLCRTICLHTWAASWGHPSCKQRVWRLHFCLRVRVFLVVHEYYCIATVSYYKIILSYLILYDTHIKHINRSINK